MTSTGRPSLRADCARCAGLCCVVPAFAASVDFAIDKPAERPCPNLQADFRCGIHLELRERGFRGCAVYDCFGAGQRLTQERFAGRTWRDHAVAARMFAAFPVVRQLHELLWYLDFALNLRGTQPLHEELRQVFQETDRLAGADDVEAIDVGTHRDRVNALLRKASDMVRAGSPGPRLDRAGADLAGANLRRADLRGASLRGAALIGADLRGADLSCTDLTGADVRGADLRGADLSAALFVTQQQLEAARGNGATRLPPGLTRPPHWHQERASHKTSAAESARPRHRPRNAQ